MVNMTVTKIFWSQMVSITGGVFNLLGLALVLDISHILYTFGSFQPVPYALVALITGFALFPSLGILLTKRSNHGMGIALLVSIILPGSAILYLAHNFFISSLGTGVLVFLLTGFTTITSALTYSTFSPGMENESIRLNMVFTDIYSFVFTFFLIVAYIRYFQLSLPTIIFNIEIIAVLDVIIAFIFLRIKPFTQKSLNFNKSI